MNNIYNLKLCVEKSLSKSDNKTIEETFGLPIETFSFIGLPGVSFKNKSNTTYQDTEFTPNEEYGDTIPGTYTGGNFNPLPDFKYLLEEEYQEKFGGTTTGASDGGLSPHKGTQYDFSPSKGTDYGFSPHHGTEYGFSVIPGITSSEQQVQSQEPTREVIGSFTVYAVKRLETMSLYLQQKFGPEVTKTIIQSPMLNNLKQQILTDMEDIEDGKIQFGTKDMLNTIGEKVLDGYTIKSYTMRSDLNLQLNGRVVMEKPGSINFVDSWDFGYDLVGGFSKDPNDSGDSQGLKAVLSIPTQPISASYTFADNTTNLYDLKKELSRDQLLEYQQEFEDVFGTIISEEEEKEKRKFIGREEYKVNTSQVSLLQRIENFVEKGLIVLTQPELGIVQSMIQRKFFVKKVTISFGNEGFAKKTPLIELEGIRDSDGNTIEIDPIEYKIRDLTPINAVKKVLRERVFPLVNLEFEFIDEKIKEGFDPLESGVIRIGFDPKGGCWSMLGMDNFFTKEEFTLNLGWLDAGTIMHEFCHFLGLIHEHQLPSGKTIQWDEPVVYNWAKVVHGWTQEETYINILKKYEVKQINGIEYDPFSIMHYFFPPQLTIDKKGSRQNLRLAVQDIKFIISVFPGKDIDYKTFYRQIYGKNIDEDSKYIHNLLKLIAGLVLIYILVRIYRKYKKSKSETYSSFTL